MLDSIYKSDQSPLLYNGVAQCLFFEEEEETVNQMSVNQIDLQIKRYFLKRKIMRFLQKLENSELENILFLSHQFKN